MPNRNEERHVSTKNMLVVSFEKGKQDWKRGGDRRGSRNGGKGMGEHKGFPPPAKPTVTVECQNRKLSTSFEPLLRQDTSMFLRTKWI